LSQSVVPVEIPDKSSFKPSEVCELLQIPSYVLRTWENEFSDLGVARSPGGARTYRRTDVELAVRIRELVFSEHLTLAGVRRRLEQEHLLSPPAPPQAEGEPADTEGAGSVSEPVRAAISHVKQELRSLLESLGSNAAAATPPVEAVASGSAPPAGRGARTARKGASEGIRSLPGFEADEDVNRSGPSADAAAPDATPPVRRDLAAAEQDAGGARRGARRGRKGGEIQKLRSEN
jgi:DNA-binding transcriptional MerR regulator